MDLDTGRGPVIGRTLPSRPADVGLTQRLRSFLSWPTTDADPVTTLIKTHRAAHSDADTATLRRGYAMAEQMHRGQSRISGEPYVTHPLAVAQILAELGMDTTTLVAALLHDTVEDTRYTLPALDADFGSEVAYLVDGVTKFDKAFYGDAAEAETIRKLLVAAGKDVRVLVIKLADRLHNMRTLDARSPGSRARISRATQDVLIPLCDRLGIQALKREIEDAVLFHLEPEAYARIDEHVQNRPGWTEYLDGVVSTARGALRRDRVDATVSPRPRHYYSIWKDTIAGGHATPFDPPRIVIVVDGPETDCYAALGAIHGLWRPVPGRFKDFVASPKNNLYRSLHTTVLGPDDSNLEVLIRTESMHVCAEYGVTVNFRAVRAGKLAGPAADEQLVWLRRVLDWEQETTDSAEFLRSLRCDLAEAQVQVFAGGRGFILPYGSTPVDVAYELGFEIGEQSRLLAAVNGREVPVSSVLEEGDLVEVVVADEPLGEFDAVDAEAPRGPRREWLTFVKSPHAQRQISRFFAEESTPGITIPDKVRLGRASIGLALRQVDRGLASDLPLRKLAEDLDYPDLETMLVAVVDRKISPETVVELLIALVDQQSLLDQQQSPVDRQQSPVDRQPGLVDRQGLRAGS